MNKEVIKELSAKAREAVATTRIVSGQREMTWLPEAFEEKFFQLATEWEREQCAKVCDARYMGDNNREDMEARRCAAAIRARGETK